LLEDFRTKAPPRTLDLATVRETLAYVHDDMRRAPGLERVAAALAAAIAEVEWAERASAPSRTRPAPARFLPLSALPDRANERRPGTLINRRLSIDP
jgi:hypothetical protein